MSLQEHDSIIPRNPKYLAAFFAVVELLLYECCDGGVPAASVMRKAHRAGFLHGYNLALFGPEARDVAHTFARIVEDLERLNLETGASGGVQGATPEPPDSQ